MEIQLTLQNTTDMKLRQKNEMQRPNPNKKYISDLDLAIAKLHDEIRALGFEIGYNIFVGYYAKKDNISILCHKVVTL